MKNYEQQNSAKNFEKQHPIKASIIGGITIGIVTVGAARYVPLTPIGVAFVATASMLVGGYSPILGGIRKWVRNRKLQSPPPPS